VIRKILKKHYTHREQQLAERDKTLDIECPNGQIVGTNDKEITAKIFGTGKPRRRFPRTQESL